MTLTGEYIMICWTQSSTFLIYKHSLDVAMLRGLFYSLFVLLWGVSPIHCILPTSAKLCFLLKSILLSPRDGTSIILSDDVGQLYILSTGQGESQKDAKYDQVHILSCYYDFLFSLLLLCYWCSLQNFCSSFSVIIDLWFKTPMVMY